MMNSLKSVGKYLSSKAWSNQGCYSDQTRYLKKCPRTSRFLLIWVISICCITSSVANASSNRLVSRYSLHLLGASIGEFSITQTGEKGNVTIDAITDVNVNVIFPYRIKYVQNTIYNQGILQSSSVEAFKNGKLNSKTSLNREEDSYVLISDGDTITINNTITYSGSLIYFNEPKGINNIYKERSAETMRISPVNEHEYIVKDEKDREINRYYYENGTLQYAEMKHTLGTIVLKRIRNKVND
jgi:hypothetical protein